MSLSNIDGIVINVTTVCRDLRTLEWFRRIACYDLLDIDCVYMQEHVWIL